MQKKTRISVCGIVTCALLLLVFVSMSLPLTEYSYYSGYYGYRHYEYTFFEMLEDAFEELDEFWGFLHVSLFLLIVGAQMFAIGSIFKNKTATGTAVTAGISFTFLLLYAMIEGVEADEIGLGGYGMGLLLLAGMIMAIVTASQGSGSPAPAATNGIVCRNCHQLAPAGSMHCNHCGAPLTTAPTVYCGSCGSPIEGEKRFCSNCGAAVPNTRLGSHNY